MAVWAKTTEDVFECRHLIKGGSDRRPRLRAVRADHAQVRNAAEQYPRFLHLFYGLARTRQFGKADTVCEG